MPTSDRAPETEGDGLPPELRERAETVLRRPEAVGASATAVQVREVVAAWRAGQLTAREAVGLLAYLLRGLDGNPIS